jgi:hypothetical protein
VWRSECEVDGVIVAYSALHTPHCALRSIFKAPQTCKTHAEPPPPGLPQWHIGGANWEGVAGAESVTACICSR